MSKTVTGTAAPSPHRALVMLSVLATTLGALAFASAPALAAAPEAPTVTVESKVPSPPSPSTEAVLHGVLNPGLVGVPGTYELDEYQFLYKAGASCAGGSVVPTPPGMSLGEGHEVLPAETLTGLGVNTEYTVCLIVRNGTGAGHESSSVPVTFKTALPPEKPETIAPAKLITATTATFEGVLNPKAAAAVKAGWYFAYNVGASCVGGSTTPLEAEATVKAVSESKGVTELQPHAQYTFCLLATNAAGEAVAGNEVAFETEAAKPEVTGETTALPVKATEATLEAQVNPNNQSTTYRFEYSTSATGETLNAPVTTLASATVLAGFGNQTAGVATGPVLAQDTTYYYRVIAENEQSRKESKPVEGTIKHFKTAIAPETPEKLEAEPIGPTTATLKGVLNPTKAGEAGTYEFAYRQSTGECQRENPETHLRENEKVSPEPAGTSGVKTPEPKETKVTGLLPGAQYTFCLIAHNSAGETVLSSPVTFTTLPAAPAIVSESVSNVESADATLEAQVSPDGAETKYHFEYGTSESFGQSTPETALTGLTGTETASARITGLQPSTTYHYRVVATNLLSPAGVTGLDRIFTTPIVLGSEPSQNCPNEQLRTEQPYGLKLPDCRAYEMVSPVDTNGQDATEPTTFSVPRASVSGEAVTYAAAGDFADSTGNTVEDQFLSRRGPEGWSTQAITPVHQPAQTETAPSYETMAFTPELTEGIASTNASLTSEGPVVSNFKEPPWGLYVDNFADHSYRYVANEYYSPFNTEGTSTDLSHVVFGAYQTSEWVNGSVVPVSVTNQGETIGATVGSAYFDAGSESYGNNAWHAVSANGSRVYFTSPGGALGAVGVVYVRVNAEQPQSPMKVVNGKAECEVPADACTIDVSASQRTVADPDPPQTARYWGASADGSRVFFTSKAELTEDAYTGPADNAANLYEYDLERPEGERLKDLTVDHADGEGAAVQGVAQISEDGSYVYFVADGALAGEAVAGKPNLYVSHEGGAPKFIATLATGDSPTWEDAGVETDFSSFGPEVNNAVVAPDGTRLAFVSERSLTGYDNQEAPEIYLYDAERNGLVCASCNPSGARPVGLSALPSGRISIAEHRPRALLDDGALFFDSADALVPHASDGRRNVYEYENGHIYPISNVAGGYESFFMDASANGDDVFFGTADQLLPQDTSNNVVVYDARVGGGFPVTVAPPSCDNGDSCKPPPSPQPGVFGAPGSATFSGPGNITPVVTGAVVKAKAKSVKCKKGYEKKKGKCVKKAKKKAKKLSDRKGSK